jgi:tripeptide aminopeptidase
MVERCGEPRLPQEARTEVVVVGELGGDDLERDPAAEALVRTGFEPSYALSGGGADANVFNARGLSCVNLANGMTDIHTPDEHIAVADLDAMVDVTLALVDAARELPVS